MIQITISEKDNPKVAGWLMDNNIEYSSVPVSVGYSELKEAISLIKFWYEFSGNKDWDLYNTHSPEMKRLNASLTPTEQQEPPKK